MPQAPLVGGNAEDDAAAEKALELAQNELDQKQEREQMTPTSQRK